MNNNLLFGERLGETICVDTKITGFLSTYNYLNVKDNCTSGLSWKARYGITIDWPRVTSILSRLT
jgi:hypothetical protein